jgi:50S ribosomal protein L16 3-hydroxylase
MLYVPPRIAHNGVAIGEDCMTYSIGFRAPARSELIADWCDDLVQHLSEDDRYTDPDLQAQTNPGEISGTAIAKLHAMITEKLGDRAAFTRWFGEYNSTPKYPEQDWAPEAPIAIAELRKLIAAGETLCRNPASRFSFVRQGAGNVLLFVDGTHFECAEAATAFAERLCAQDRVNVAPELLKSDAVVELIVQLFNQGSIGFEAED